MRRYARLHDFVPEGEGAAGWMRLYPHAFPQVLIVLAGKPRPALERRMDTLMAVLGKDRAVLEASGLVVSCVLLEDLVAQGPFAPIFVRHRDPGALVDWLGA